MRYLLLLLLSYATTCVICSENQLLILSNNNNRSDSTSLNTHFCFMGTANDENRIFEYRSEDNYNANPLIRPLKKIIDYTFCENRDSCCIKEGSHPTVCSSCCVAWGSVCGGISSIGKLLSIGIFTDPQNMNRNFCSRCACDFSWFPLCSQQFNCGYDGSLDATCCAQSMMWCSSCGIITSFSLITCLVCRELLKEKKK